MNKTRIIFQLTEYDCAIQFDAIMAERGRPERWANLAESQQASLIENVKSWFSHFDDWAEPFNMAIEEWADDHDLKAVRDA